MTGSITKVCGFLCLFGQVLPSLAGPASAQQLPDGFAVYSKGDTFDRTLHMVTLKPGMTQAEISASEKKLVDKGPSGGDIQGQISFDGKWLAFSRSEPCATDSLDGNDYHKFECWSVQIIKLHGSGVATPIQIAGKGAYWPSWGDDSYGDTKTLYYSLSNNTKHSTVRAVTVDANGALSNDRQVADIFQRWPDGTDGLKHERFVMAAPNGTFVAARWSGSVYAAHLSGPLAGQRFKLNGGCMPAICADSEWIIHANNKRGRFDGKSTGAVQGDGSGDYHYGSSADMKWFAARTAGDWQVQNTGFATHLMTLEATASSFVTKRQVQIAAKGSWPDVHAWAQAAPGGQVKIQSFAAHPASIAKGGESTLSWSTIDATAVKLEGQAASAADSKKVKPTQTTTYELVAEGPGGPVTRQVTVEVTEGGDPSADPGAGTVGNALRINCGSNDQAVPGWDNDDAYVNGGGDWTNPDPVSVGGVQNAAPVDVYRTVRHQTPHSYRFPVADGQYTLRIHFADAFGDRSMRYAAEGQTLLENFDIVTAAGGKNLALVREFTVTVSGGDGLLLEASGTDDVFEAGIEVIPQGGSTDPPIEDLLPSITILSPLQGDRLEAGSTHQIRWTTNNLSDVGILYSLDGDQRFESITQTVDDGQPEWGDFPWQVPDQLTDQAQIQIMGYFGEAPTVSGTFAIVPVGQGSVAEPGAEPGPGDANNLADAGAWLAGGCQLDPGSVPTSGLPLLLALVLLGLIGRRDEGGE